MAVISHMKHTSTSTFFIGEFSSNFKLKIIMILTYRMDFSLKKNGP
jgi:hypothetical protein